MSSHITPDSGKLVITSPVKAKSLIMNEANVLPLITTNNADKFYNSTKFLDSVD
jgi:hypothetical protein|tara:strand:- start:1110 stop:1271 length:162 start_codon:yes stop_codon:yes gene_type:complete